ncbi:MAG: hypothetical protein ACK5P7_00170 [Bdellovibrio sp.]
MLLIGLCSLFLAVNLHWSDSELWALALSQKAQGPLDPSFFYKPLFYSILKLIGGAAPSSLAVVDFNRVFFAGLGLAQLFLFQKVAKKLSGSVALSWALTFLWGTSALFLTQSFKIRSDSLASFFCFLIFFLYLQVGSKLSRQHFLICLVGLLMMALLVTPKAMIHVGLLFVCLQSLPARFRIQGQNSFFWWAFALPVVLFLGLAFLNWQEMQTATAFFFQSYWPSAHRPAAWSLASFSHVFEFCVQQPQVLALLLLSFVLTGPARIPLLMLALAILGYSDRLPFYLYSLLWFPLACCALGLEKMPKLTSSLALVSCVTSAGFVFLSLKMIPSAPQRLAMIQMQKYLSDHQNPLYFDATGVLSKQRQILAWPAPEHPGNQQEILSLLENKSLELVFMGHRSFHYFQDFLLTLEKNHFIQVGPGVFAKILLVDPENPSSWPSAELCKKFFGTAPVFVYSGTHFLQMNLAKNAAFSCTEKKMENFPPGTWLALSRFEPLLWGDSGVSFSSLFAHDELQVLPLMLASGLTWKSQTSTGQKAQ